jgi:hypothetical protein
MKKYTVRLKSTSPLILNVRKKEIDDEKEKLKRNELKEWEEKNWREKAPFDAKGNVIIPIKWIRASFVNACKHSRKVPNFAVSKKETYTRYAEAMIFDGSTFKCNVKELKCHGEFMGGTGANSTTKVWKVFPRIDDWETEIIVNDPSGRMTKEEFEDLFHYAGLFEGIGDFRKVNCGRYEISSIKEIK